MKNKMRISIWQLFLLMALISAAIPIAITAYELITTEKDSVVFLGDYPPLAATLILCYYIFLALIGIAWLVKQIIDLIKLKNERAKNEVIHLQSQVNPHFFFNVLNNLYGLVDKDSQKAKLLILKLSDMMRYSIYDGQKQLVTIAEEVDYLKNYIDLHQMRYHKKIDIRFESNIEDHDLKIMPLMFINLLENAFKHGVEHLRANAFVYINLDATKKSLHFSVENNFDPEERSKKKGLGLSNLQRRLELVYPKKHSLSTEQMKNVFKSQLTLTRYD